MGTVLLPRITCLLCDRLDATLQFQRRKFDKVDEGRYRFGISTTESLAFNDSMTSIYVKLGILCVAGRSRLYNRESRQNQRIKLIRYGEICVF